MAILSPTFMLGVVVLVYLSTFVLFAVLRILTGISIQRIGYLSLRRLAYTPKDGIKLEIRGLGLHLHRPTFAQPTWVSVVLTEFVVTVDLEALEGGNNGSNGAVGTSAAQVHDDASQRGVDNDRGKERHQEPAVAVPYRSQTWKNLTILKERIKRLHRKINWIRLVDVIATNSSVQILNVGTFQIGNYTMAVDTRRKMVDRGRLFGWRKKERQAQRPAEWRITLRSILFTPDGKESLEVLDHATLNVHGLLYRELDGLRDAAVELKLGRVHLPVDDLQACYGRFVRLKQDSRGQTKQEVDNGYSMASVVAELDQPGSQESLAQTVSDSKEFISSILRGIKEVQFAASYIGLTKRVDKFQPSGSPIYINASMKEVGVDLHRLDPRSPAHRMYFSPKDIAHQALLAALSISVGVDDGQGKSDRLVYIPMATTTVRTTLPSKTVEFTNDRSADERNANILFANVVITSPSMDFDPKHLPLILALMQPRPKANIEPSQSRHALISRLLPKANVKFSMHEPVIRISLPPIEKTEDDDDFDLIISSISSVSLDVESSHSAVGDLHYSLASTFRVQTHDLYYQTSTASRYKLLHTESMELKVQLSATPEVYVVASGNLQTFSIHMVRPEISDGVRQIVRQLRTDVQPDKKGFAKSSRDPNILRSLPDWLLHVHLQASDCSAEVAGVDADVSDGTRGVAVQLDSWSAEYRARRLSGLGQKNSRRRTGSKSVMPDAELLKSPPASPRKTSQQPTDGRRLAIHIRGLDAFVIESADKWESDAFLSMPRYEIALSTTSDKQGPIFHLNSHIRTLLIQYSLYRHYAIGVATMVLRRVFVRTKADYEEAAATTRTTHSDYLAPSLSPRIADIQQMGDLRTLPNELMSIDLRVTLLQIKAHMPADPPLMFQAYGFEAGRHRWSPPFFHAKLLRLYVEAPKMRHVWARLASVKTARIDLRDGRRKLAVGGYQDESFVDINTEAIRLAVPHQLVLHKVFDNVVNTIKATEQLHHRFKTGTNEYILEKQPEGPKHVPKISIRSRALLFELEDGAFEWKLGRIYRTGLIEQQQRLARDEAFNVKMKKIGDHENRRESSRYRNRSTYPRGKGKNPDSRLEDNRSDDEPTISRGRSRSRGERRRMRYDPEGTCGLTGTARVSVQEAEQRLKRYNSQSWKKRIDLAYSVQRSGMKDLRGVFWGPDQLPTEMEDMENILEVPQRPALMSTLISDLQLIIDKPSFPLSQLNEFLHKIGKGMPYDMKYALLIPMNVRLDMGEVKMSLRDYPLPLLHVPAMKPNQSSRVPSWSLRTDFVIAEEFRGSQSSRHVRVEVVPPKVLESSREGGFSIDVRRTISPVKSYSDITIDINTGFPTRITWGASYQPAIQDMMMVIEGFTKPQADPSDRAGFWDKIRLSFHSRVLVSWKGDGDVHLLLKGTRDPYAITGNGAGFLMCWRNEVRWSIWRENDPKKFMTVDSGDYVLAIPDYSHQARGTDKSSRDDESMESSSSYKRGAIFKKVVMKLSGNVQWLAGLVFERSVGEGKRSFDFEPHYKVIFKEPAFATAPPGQVYDAFRGFRSQFIHLSIAVKAPADREWSVSNSSPSRSYNTVHLTPRFFTHFFAWWSIFGGPMSLPIRQGRLWPGIEKSSKKFGRHLATIKYNLLLAPLFISHIYKHKDAEDYSEDVVSATGLKIRLDNFMLDMHQRREEFSAMDKGRRTQQKTTHMKIHKAQLDLVSADIRAVSASIAGTTPADLRQASLTTPANQRDAVVADLPKFQLPDNDFSWIDMDDFVELDWILPSEANPETKIMPLAYAPRFTYLRQCDQEQTEGNTSRRSSRFGGEDTHYCVMTKDDDPRKVQHQLMQARLKELESQKSEHQRNLGEAELRMIRDAGQDSRSKAEYEQLRNYGHLMRDKQVFLESMMQRLSAKVDRDPPQPVPNGEACGKGGTHMPPAEDQDDEPQPLGTSSTPDFVSDFNNRFVIHNMQLKWNNSLRNTILRYIHQVSQRRGFVYYMSRRAVKFILDIVEEQHKAKASKENQTAPAPSSEPTKSSTNLPSDDGASIDIEERIKEILADGKKFVSADDPKQQEEPSRVSTEYLSSHISDDFMPQNSYHLRLIAPQIQLQSEKNPKSVVLVTAKGMEGKVVEVMDKDRISDDVSGLVQRRFSVEMDSTQFFVTHQKWFSSQLLSIYSGSHYGAPKKSAWPPWVPMEVMFDFEGDPFGFKRVVEKTSATLRYDKYNTLRLKYNDEVGADERRGATHESPESRMDHLWVEFPQVRAICDSSQYYAMYIIVLDLLLYNEPLEKTRSERLEKIMLASDFSDLRGAPEMVVRLQERIRQLEDIKTQFHIHSKYLDEKGWEDRILLSKDLTSCEDELFFMMKAITTSQRKYDGSQVNGLLRWNIAAEQIVWHLMRNRDHPLVEFQLQNAEYNRTDNSDGSHVNLVQIGKIVGLNLLPDAIYPEMIAPYIDPERGALNDGGSHQMLRVYWYMLEAIAGIPVMDHFEVNLFPMKIQLEHEIGKRLFEYIFPSSGSKPGQNGENHSPFLPNYSVDEEDDSSYNLTKTSSYVSITEVERQDALAATRAGSLELRLRPTMDSESRPKAGGPPKPRSGSTFTDGTHFRLFQSNKAAYLNPRPASIKTVSKKPSLDSMRSSHTPRQALVRSPTTTSLTEGSSTQGHGKPKRFTIHRSAKPDPDNAKPSDDLTKMMSRASNYMTLAYVKIPSVVLCLSYKGKSDRNLVDVHDFVFRMPMLEYRNKTWSNLDLALALKKDVIKALISHTGAIIGNKFSKHRPTTAQQSRLRELATSSVLLAPSSHDASHDNSSDGSSTRGTSPTNKRSSERSRSPRRSFASSNSGLTRTASATSSINSVQSRGGAPGLPASMTMTPAVPPRGARDGAEGDLNEEAVNSSMYNGDHDHRGGKLAHALGHFKLNPSGGKSRNSGAGTDAPEETEDGRSQKGKLPLGKRLFGSRGER
jgi:hypothetical protein